MQTPSAVAIAERFWKHVNKQGTIVREDLGNCWEWTGQSHEKGYGWMEFALKNPKKFVVRAHRLVWILIYGEIPDGVHVLHRCDNPPCVRPEHLFLGDDDDNCQDAIRKGRRWQSISKSDAARSPAGLAAGG